MSDITPYSPTDTLTPRMGATAAEVSRIKRYNAYLTEEGISWLNNKALASWRDELLDEGLAAATVSAYVSTVRAVILHHIKTDAVRDHILAHVHQTGGGGFGSPIDVMRERLDRLTYAIEGVTVSLTAKKDRADGEHIRLTADEVDTLLSLPDLETLRGIRDRAMIGLTLATGIRSEESADLLIDDLHQSYGGHPAILIREGKGNAQRVVLYGDNISELEWVMWWLHELDDRGYTTEADDLVWRPIDRWDKPMHEPMHKRSLARALKRYPITRGEHELILKPHDLRRTYARRMYESGMSPAGIQANLGHTDIALTYHYIGEVNADERLSKPIGGNK